MLKFWFVIEFIAFIELKENKTKSLLHAKWKGPYVCVIFHIIFFSIIIISISFPCHIVQTRPDQYLRHRNISYFFCFLNTQHLWWCVLQNHFPKIVWIFYRLKFNHYFVKTQSFYILARDTNQFWFFRTIIWNENTSVKVVVPPI